MARSRRPRPSGTGAAPEDSEESIESRHLEQFLFNMLREGDRAATITTLRVVLNWTDGLQ